MAKLACRVATFVDARTIESIRRAAAADLTARFGVGAWSSVTSLRRIQQLAGRGQIYLVEEARVPVATFLLADRRPPFCRLDWFADRKAPACYMRHFAVHPERQGRGVGRLVLAEIERLARARGAEALRFDAYRGEAGAGPFYAKCGYAHVHSGSVEGVALDFYEKRLVD